MRANRRRLRTIDPLASPKAVRSLCSQLREHLPEQAIPRSEKELLRFLYAVRHVERRPATDTRRGRPGRWSRENLITAASVLRSILERETRGRVSLSSFISQYLQVLDFPSDVNDALVSGDLNLQEAASLARLTAERLGCSARAARVRRHEILQSHLAVQGSQTRLRAQVRELLGETSELEIGSKSIRTVIEKVDEMLEIDPADSRHLFWEEMKRLLFAMREIEPDDLDEETMNAFLQAIDGVSNILYRIEKKRQKRAAEPPEKLRM
jgi:hypothetical protein